MATVEMERPTAVVPYAQPHSGLIKHNGKFEVTRGFRTDALLEYLTSEKNLHRSISVTELAQLFYGRSTEGTRMEIRTRLSRSYRRFLDKGYLLLFNLSGIIYSVKIFDKADPKDLVWAERELERRRSSPETTMREIYKAEELVGIEHAITYE
jgi:hypothetical protein